MKYQDALENLLRLNKPKTYAYMKKWRNKDGSVSGWDGHIQTIKEDSLPTPKAAEEEKGEQN